MKYSSCSIIIVSHFWELFPLRPLSSFRFLVFDSFFDNYFNFQLFLVFVDDFPFGFFLFSSIEIGFWGLVASCTWVPEFEVQNWPPQNLRKSGPKHWEYHLPRFPNFLESMEISSWRNLIFAKNLPHHLPPFFKPEAPPSLQYFEIIILFIRVKELKYTYLSSQKLL